MKTTPCGCRTTIDPASGVRRSIAKCYAHRRAYRDPGTLDEAYYRQFGVLNADGTLAETQHVAELVEALGEFPEVETAAALEIGCGCSPYASAIMGAGWSYYGTDASPAACNWTRRTFGATALCCSSEAIDTGVFGGEFSLILAAHIFEHLADAPAAIAKAARLLAPGGELWVIVPDDSDLCNPDHLWFFTEPTLLACLDRAGLSVERFAVHRRVKHELFIYARARKPA